MKKRLLALALSAMISSAYVAPLANVPEAKAVYSWELEGAFHEYRDNVSDDSGLTYRIFKDHAALIEVNWDRSGVILPETVEGVPLTIITDEAFFGAETTFISIPATVTDLGTSLGLINTKFKVELAPENKYYTQVDGNIFTADMKKLVRCAPLSQNLSIPASVTSIEYGAFNGCTAIESIDVDSKNKIYSSNGGVLFDIFGESLIQYPAGSQNKSYTVPDSVKEICSDAFRDSAALEAVTLPDHIELIGDGAFANCGKLNNVVIPESVTDIGESAFVNCESLSKITFSSSITNVGINAMSNTAWYGAQKDGVVYIGNVLYNVKGKLPKDSAITVKAGTVGISQYAFCTGSDVYDPNNSGDQNLISVVLPDGIKYIREYAFYGCRNLKEINLPDSISRISFGAFENCSSLKKVNIPKSLTSIEYRVFGSCSSLEEVVIPDNIRIVNNNAFVSCDSLKSMTFEGNPQLIDDIFGAESTVSGENVSKFKGTIRGYDHSTAQSFAKHYGYDFVSLGALNNNSSEEYNTADIKTDGTWDWMDLKDHVVLCGYHGNSDTVSIPNTIDELPVKSFIQISEVESAEKVKTVKIPANFEDQRSLLEYFGSVSFFEVDKNNKYFTTENNVLYSADKKTLIRCSTDKIEGMFNIPNTVTDIAYGAFDNCSKLTSIYVPASVNNIGDTTFSGCTSLAEVNVAKGNQEYSSSNGILFSWNKTMLLRCPQKHPGASYTIPDGVELINNSAFFNCDSLTSVDFPGTVDTISYAAFRNCDKLDNIVLPDALNILDESAFENCKSLKSIRFSDNISTFGSLAMYGTPWLESQPDGPVYCGTAFYTIKGDTSKISEIKVKDGTKCIADNAFSVLAYTNDGYVYVHDNKGLKNVVLPDTITSIGKYAFENCTALISANMPRSVTQKGIGLFMGCNSLKDIVLSENADEIKESEFALCEALSNVVVPKNISKIYFDAFGGCFSLDSITIMNPDCEIDSGKYAINNIASVSDDGEETVRYHGVICGYEGSTAEAYAKECGYKFKSIGKIPAAKLGDIDNNGSIDAVDASAVLSYYAQISTNKDGGFTAEQKSLADVDHNGAINAVDASCILSYYAYCAVTKDTVKKTLEEFLK